MSPPADNWPVKIGPVRAAAGRGGFLPVNFRPRIFFWRRSYNGAPAAVATVRSMPQARSHLLIHDGSSGGGLVHTCTSHNGRNNYRQSVGHSPVVRSSHSARRGQSTDTTAAVRRINQPKNYKHASSARPTDRRLSLRAFFQAPMEIFFPMRVA